MFMRRGKENVIFGSGRDKVAKVQGKKPVIDHEKV